MAIAMQQCLVGSRWIFLHLHLITVHQFNFLQAVYVYFAIFKAGELMALNGGATWEYPVALALDPKSQNILTKTRCNSPAKSASF
jgi:hypothetical protein